MGNTNGVNTDIIDGIGKTPEEAIINLKAKIPQDHYLYDHATELEIWETQKGFYETNLIVKSTTGLYKRAEINHLQGTKSDYYRAWFNFLRPSWDKTHHYHMNNDNIQQFQQTKQTPLLQQKPILNRMIRTANMNKLY